MKKLWMAFVTGFIQFAMAMMFMLFVSIWCALMIVNRDEMIGYKADARDVRDMLYSDDTMQNKETSKSSKNTATAAL